MKFCQLGKISSHLEFLKAYLALGKILKKLEFTIPQIFFFVNGQILNKECTHLVTLFIIFNGGAASARTQIQNKTCFAKNDRDLKLQKI